MLVSIPDFRVTPEGNVNPGGLLQRDPATDAVRRRAATATRQRMGRAPKGFKPFARSTVRQPDGGRPAASRPTASTSGGTRAAPTAGNCWHNNVGADGTARERHRPGRRATARLLPTDCDDAATATLVKLDYLLSCFLAREGDVPPEQLRLVHAAAAAGLAGRERESRRRSNVARASS